MAHVLAVMVDSGQGRRYMPVESIVARSMTKSFFLYTTGILHVYILLHP